MSCAEIRARLAEAALSRQPISAPERRHAEECADCATELSFLEALVTALDDAPPPLPLSPAAVTRCKRQTLRALRAQQVPPGFGWALTRALGLALLVLPVVFAHAWLVVRAGSLLLSPWLPEVALLWLALMYFGSLALGLGAVYGSIPVLVAFRQQRQRELA